MKLHEIAEQHPYPVLFATLTGSRVFGYASADSDYDVQGVHLLPAQTVLGLDQPHDETIEKKSANIDLATHDLRKFVRLLLNGNGNVLETLYSPIEVYSTSIHHELKRLGKGCITKQLALHYKGMAYNQQRRLQANELKKLIHTYRCLLMGIHLMETGRLEMSLPALASIYHQPQVKTLIEQKREWDGNIPDPGHLYSLEVLEKKLDQAYEESHLPASATTRTELEQLVVKVRLEGK